MIIIIIWWCCSRQTSFYTLLFVCWKVITKVALVSQPAVEKNNSASLGLKIQWPSWARKKIFSKQEGMLVGIGCREYQVYISDFCTKIRIFAAGICWLSYKILRAYNISLYMVFHQESSSIGFPSKFQPFPPLQFEQKLPKTLP